MTNELRNIIEKLAIERYRKVGGNSWMEVMTLMQTLIEEKFISPKIEEWIDENGITCRNFSLFFKGKKNKKLLEIRI